MAVTIPIYRLQLVRDAHFRTQTKQIRQPDDAARILSAYLDGLTQEHFVVCTLDVKNRMTGIQTIAIGTLNQVAVHLRDVFKFAVLMNASAIIAGHNHPSGDPTPSRPDAELTQRIQAAGQLLDIPLLDHIIVGDDGNFVSFQAEPARFAPARAAETC